MPVQEIFSALVALVGPIQNIFSSPYTISIPLSISPSKLGRQPCWVACLLVRVSGISKQREDIGFGKQKEKQPQLNSYYSIVVCTVYYILACEKIQNSENM